MKAWQYFVMAGSVVLLLGAGALHVQQRAEIEDWKGRALNAESESARRTAERTALEKDTRDAQEQVTALQAQLAEAREKPAATSAGKPREAATADEKITPDTVKQWLSDADDPAVLRRLNTQARNQTLRHYTTLLSQLNLPAEQTEAFTKLLTDKRQTPLDIAVTSLKDGGDPTKNMDDFRTQIIESRIEIENQIHALLGDAAYAQYQTYDQNFGQTNVLNNLQTALLGTAEPLTPEQAARLTQVLQANNATRITTPVIADAKEFLSPAQWQALQDLRAIQQANSQKRLQPGQILPTEPAKPGSKP